MVAVPERWFIGRDAHVAVQGTRAQLTCYLPPRLSRGLFDVTVTNPDHARGTLAEGFGTGQR